MKKNEQPMKKIEMLYKDYKNLYSQFSSVPKSYNAQSKTIMVLVPEDFEIPVSEAPAPEKSPWKSLNINTNLIEATTPNSVKIAMPHSSRYDGFSFWHPAKLIREGCHSASFSISYTDEFSFQLKKYGKGQYNKGSVLAATTIDASDFEEAFGVIHSNNTAPVEKPLVHVPRQLEPSPVTIPEELRDE